MRVSKPIIAAVLGAALLLLPSVNSFKASAATKSDEITTLFDSYAKKDSKFFAKNIWGIMKIAMLSIPKEERAALKNVKGLWLVTWKDCSQEVADAFLKDLSALTSSMQTMSDTDEKGNEVTMYYTVASDGSSVENPIAFVKIKEKVEGQELPTMIMYIQGVLPMEDAQGLVEQAA